MNGFAAEDDAGILTAHATMPAMLIRAAALHGLEPVKISRRDRARGMIYHWHRAGAPLLRREECRRCGCKLEPQMRRGARRKDLCSVCLPLDPRLHGSMEHTHV